jgi:hypothetical protein
MTAIIAAAVVLATVLLSWALCRTAADADRKERRRAGALQRAGRFELTGRADAAEILGVKGPNR